MLRTIMSGFARGLLLFLPWAALRLILLQYLSIEGPEIREWLTDVEFYSLDLKPARDFYVLLGIFAFALLLGLTAWLRKGSLFTAASWGIGALSCFVSALAMIIGPVLVMSGRLPNFGLIEGTYERRSWVFGAGLCLIWIAGIIFLRLAGRNSFAAKADEGDW